MLDPLYKVIGFLIAVYYSLIPNLGIAIILLTCTVMLALFPLTAKQARSMIQMQRVQPEIKRIQQEYKNDKTKQNEEILKFYQENKINPLSGCLPLLMQLPVFFSLYGVIRNTDDHVPERGAFGDLFADLQDKSSGATHFLSMDLTRSAAEAMSQVDAFVGRIPYLVLVALVVATGWYQARQTQLRQQRSGTPNPLNQQMMILTKVLPIMFGVFSYGFAAGLVLYFVTSNLFRIGQQHLVLNKIYDEGRAENERAKSPKAKPAVIDVEAVDDAPAGTSPASRPRPRPAASPSRHTSRKKKKRRR